MFYAATNRYATESSVGFSNTWYVLGFATKQTRDAFVNQATDRATKAIKASEIRDYDEQPGKVSYYDANGDFHMHMENGEFFLDSAYTIDVLTGVVSRHF